MGTIRDSLDASGLGAGRGPAIRLFCLCICAAVINKNNKKLKTVKIFLVQKQNGKRFCKCEIFVLQDYRNHVCFRCTYKQLKKHI